MKHRCWLPIRYCRSYVTLPTTLGITVETCDISLTGRILANFAKYLQPNQRLLDYLSELNQLVITPQANIHQATNISAFLTSVESCH